MNHADLHLLQALHRLAAGQDEALLCLPRGTPGGQFLIVEAVEEGTQGRGFGKRKAQAPFRAGIPGQEFDILRTIAAGGLQQEQSLEALAFGEPAFAGFAGKMGGDEVGHFQGAQGGEVARSPAWGLAISSRGRGSISKGDLCWTGSRAGMARYGNRVYNMGRQKSAPTPTSFTVSKNYARIRATAQPKRGMVGHPGAMPSLTLRACKRIFTAMITVESLNGVTHVSFPENEVSPTCLNAFLDSLRQPEDARVTMVPPLPRAVLERLYAQGDEFAEVTAEQLAVSQVQEEPR